MARRGGCFRIPQSVVSKRARWRGDGRVCAATSSVIPRGIAVRRQAAGMPYMLISTQIRLVCMLHVYLIISSHPNSSASRCAFKRDALELGSEGFLDLQAQLSVQAISYLSRGAHYSYALARACACWKTTNSRGLKRRKQSARECFLCHSLNQKHVLPSWLRVRMFILLPARLEQPDSITREYRRSIFRPSSY